ncbi:MAG: hypothetical protein V1660_00645 [archaeon]
MKIDFHVHPYLEQYGAKDIVKAMQKRSIGATGLAGFNKDIFDNLRRRFETESSIRSDSDSLMIETTDQAGNKLYFPRISEYQNKEGFHILVMGNQKDICQDAPIKKNIENALTNDSFVVIDHPFVALNYSDIQKNKSDYLFSLCKEYSGKIALEWNGYCIPILRNSIDKILCSPLRIMGRDIEFGDVNKKLEDFVSKTKGEGLNCPLIADTDLHARSASDLCLIGTSNINADVKSNSGKEFIDSIKQKIFSSDYSITKDYVQTSHFILSYGIPVMLGKINKRIGESMMPRG